MCATEGDARGDGREGRVRTASVLAFSMATSEAALALAATADAVARAFSLRAFICDRATRCGGPRIATKRARAGQSGKIKYRARDGKNRDQTAHELGFR